MLKAGKFLAVLAILLASLGLMIQPAQALTQPCATAAASATAFPPISGGNSIYCQTSYGWSDTWFKTTQPGIYNASLDVLSGDDAPRLTWDGMPTSSGAGSANTWNFISPYLDGGTLNSVTYSTPWSITSTIAVTTANGPNGINQAVSTIALGPISVTITTTVGLPGNFGNDGVTEQFAIKNDGGTGITGLTLGDYFNLHPYGSAGHGSNLCGTTVQSSGTIITSAAASCGSAAEVVPYGLMFGSLAPSAWDVGTVSNVLNDIATNAQLNNNGPVGPTDSAGYLQWGLGSLGAHQTTTFTVYKNVTELSSPSSSQNVPEPFSLSLLGTGLIALGLVRRRRRR